MIEKIVLAAVGAVFAAGGAWSMMKQLRRDVNGIGRKTHRIELITLMYCPEEQRKELGNIFLSK
jgi:hypothetical protein